MACAHPTLAGDAHRAYCVACGVTLTAATARTIYLPAADTAATPLPWESASNVAVPVPTRPNRAQRRGRRRRGLPDDPFATVTVPGSAR